MESKKYKLLENKLRKMVREELMNEVDDYSIPELFEMIQGWVSEYKKMARQKSNSSLFMIVDKMQKILDRIKSHSEYK